jgi:hypothetical protein
MDIAASLPFTMIGDMPISELASYPVLPKGAVTCAPCDPQMPSRPSQYVPPPRPTPIVPFVFAPRVPSVCNSVCDLQSPLLCNKRRTLYQPLAPQYVWNGIEYVYSGSVPLTPPVWWIPRDLRPSKVPEYIYTYNSPPAFKPVTGTTSGGLPTMR